MKRYALVFLLFSFVFFSTAYAEESRLLGAPSISDNHVAFVYANDIWVVSRDGGVAQRVTTHKGTENNPKISPDGKWIAFTGQYDGNSDVYVITINGGEPKRLTFHPGADKVRGWTNDGKRVLFASGRKSVPVPFDRLWTVSVDGGMPELLALPMANRGSYSPDGRKLAYVRVGEVFNAWRHYRGGTTTRVWLADLNDYSLEKIPQQDNSNDTFPNWIGDKVYFLSDRNHTMNLFSYNTATKEIEQLTNHDDYDVKYASGGGGAIVYEQAGYLHVYDPATKTAGKMTIEALGDMPWRRQHYANVSRLIQSGDISPTGQRAVFSARGDVFTVPAKKGDFRNLTMSSGANDRVPAWSPDGKQIAWFSDASGEYQLMIADQKGTGEPKAIDLEKPSYYYDLSWSADSKKLLFTDKRLSIFYVEIESGEVTKVDKDYYDHPVLSIDPVWSPDSNWIAYCKRLPSHLHAIFVYSLEEKKAHQLTDGLSDAVTPAWDKDGKYLYFLASTNYALGLGWLDMSSLERPITMGVYLVVLNSEDKSPLLPESDEEEVKEEEKAEDVAAEDKKPEEGKDVDKKKEDKLEVKISFEGISQRILALDIPLRNYYWLKTGEKGTIFYCETVPNKPGFTLHRYTLKDKKSEMLLEGVNNYSISADGKKMLYASQGGWAIANTAGKPKPGDGRLNTSQLTALIDPAKEWKQIYREAWRINRDFFYDEKMHGADWDAMYEKYEPLLKYVRHRSDLNYILRNLIGEMTVGHSGAGGGQMVSADRIPGGLLGANFSIDGGYYKFDKIYNGENWNPTLRAPLTQPGLNVKEGDYLVAVRGKELKAPMNVYCLFQGTADKLISISVNDKPTLDGARTITVQPVASEFGLRAMDWIEGNRRKVDEMSGGKLAYVYLPNTSWAGYVNFNRYYFSQGAKEGAIIDERFNGGGFAADYFVDLMDRPVLSYWATRDGKEFTTPMAAIFGPKVMIINEYAGSGGDALPFYFRKRAIGPIVGKTTWGGLVGHHGGADLMDGGYISSPNLAMYNTEGNWDVENIGVPPDIDVEMTPALVISGKDPQLERAVEEALKMLKEKPVKWVPRPKPIDRTSPPK